MATQTQHFNLTKPDWEDRASISVLNANTDIIDAQMYDNEQSAANAIGNMAAEYNDTATYDVGDFCIYSEVLYKCVTAVSVAEAFDSTKWTQTTAAENFGGGGGGGSGHTYSTTEQVVGTWIDGSTVYEKTVIFGTMPAAGATKSVAHGINNLGSLVDATFVISNGSESRTIPVVSRGSATSQNFWEVDATDVIVYAGTSADITTDYDGYITLRYTKSSS